MLAIALVSVLSMSAKKESTEEFQSVKVSVPAQVRIVESEEYGISIRSHEALMEEAINWTIEDGELKISSRDVEQLNPEGKDLIITVMTPVMPEIRVSQNMQLS